MMPTKAMIMREYYGCVAVVLSLLLGSFISADAFLVSPQSSAVVVFAPVNHPRQSKALQLASVPFFAAAAAETSATTTTKSEAAASVAVKQNQMGGGSNNNNKNDDEGRDPYARIGISDEALALGVNAEEVIKYIGSREDLIQKTMTDIPKMKRPQAEIEVDKFLLDAEALQVYIELYKRREIDPTFVVPKDEDDAGFFSIRNLVYIYVAYVVYSSGPIAFQKYVRSQVEAGSWKGTGVPQLDEWLLQEAPVAATVASVADTASSAVSDATASTALSSMDTVMQAVQVVGDSLN